MDARYSTSLDKSIPRLWPYFIVCAVAAVWINLGGLHSGHNGDSILSVLISLQHWTPYFWGQDRIGMLVALIAVPFRDPLTNLLVQGFFYVFSFLAAMFLLARYMLRDGGYALVGAVCVAAFLALAPVHYRFNFLIDTLSGVWLALGFGALVLLEPSPQEANLKNQIPRTNKQIRRRGWLLVLGIWFFGSCKWRRWVFAIICMILAHWAFIAAGLVLGPLVIFRGLFCPSSEPLADSREPASDDDTEPPSAGAQRSTWMAKVISSAVGRELLVVAVGFVVGFIFMRLVPHSLKTRYGGTLPPGEWLATSWQLLSNTWANLIPHTWPFFLAGGAGLGLLLLSIPGIRRRSGPGLGAALALAAAGVAWWLFAGTRRWVVLNACADRYILPSVFLWQAALIIAAVGPLAAALPKRNRWLERGAIAGLLLLSIMAGYQPPSLSGVRATLDRELGGYTADILAARCDFVAGDYWKVWPTVFHANLALHERRENRTIWGITLRSAATKDLWPEVPPENLRIAVPNGGEQPAPQYLAFFKFPPLTIAERRPTIQVWKPQTVGNQKQISEAPAIDPHSALRQGNELAECQKSADVKHQSLRHPLSAK